MLPTFIGIGAPKAGTTWLASALGQHPEICMGNLKEPDYFSFHFERDSEDQYEALFETTASTKAVGEFSTGYLIHRDAPRRIAQRLPDVQLLVVVRNPIQQIYSLFWHYQRQNFHTGDPEHANLSLEDALQKFPDHLTKPAHYAYHLQRWLQHFPRESLHCTVYDDIKADPDQALADIYRFLRVDPDYTAPHRQDSGSGVRQGTAPRSARAARIGAAAYANLNRLAYKPLKRIIGVERAATLKDALRVRLIMERLFRTRGYPAMNPDTRAALLDQFKEPNQQLAELIGRDLSHWNRP